MLAYYEEEIPTGVNVVFLGKNIGPGCVYDYGYAYKGEDYIISDSDVVPAECCPKDLLEKMVEVLGRHYPKRKKIGPGLRTDNLPDTIPYKARIIKENEGFWTHRLDNDCFGAAIDTTFALYKAGDGWQGPDPNIGIRLDHPYVFEHTPWYVWPLTDEEKYYANRTLPVPISHIREFWRQEGVDVSE